MTILARAPGRLRNRQRRLSTQRGQSSFEYAVVCTALGMALFFPLQDKESPDQPRSTIAMLLQAFRDGYQKFSHALSLPD
ncbi:MAG: hypothetical protein JWP36_738 [Paucimonas sp.]|nr:hypothetical protein [Paucimonas sp.]